MPIVASGFIVSPPCPQPAFVQPAWLPPELVNLSSLAHAFDSPSTNERRHSETLAESACPLYCGYHRAGCTFLLLQVLRKEAGVKGLKQEGSDVRLTIAVSIRRG